MAWNPSQTTNCREFDDTVALFRREHPTSGLGAYSTADWSRLRTAYELAVGTSVLDIGIGNGALLHVFARSGRFDRICGVDIRPHSTLIMPEGAEFHAMSVAELTFGEAEFDTVVCMEVLEHLETPQFVAALPLLRRVTRSRLIMTVPLDEPLPLWWHDRPGGHRQQFTKARLRELFPNARACVHARPGGVSWIFLVEEQAAAHRLEPLDSVLRSA